MRFMGIDYGTKRVGIALTDEHGTMAFPYATYANDDALFVKVTALCKEKEVSGVVIGQSHNLDNTPNRLQSDTDAFVIALRQKLRMPIISEPEQFSTQAAMRIQGRNTQTDASAAALILDAYLTRRNAREGQKLPQ